MTGVVGVASRNTGVRDAFLRALSEESANGTLVIDDMSAVGIVIAVPRAGERWVPSMVHDGNGSFCVIDGDTRRLGDPTAAGESLLGVLARGESLHAALEQIDEPVMISSFDESSGVLTVSRDPMGLGPVFFAVEGDTLWWSSSLSLLRKVTPRSGIDRDAIDFFISSGFTPAPWTFTRSHRKLSAGELVQWSRREPPRTVHYSVIEPAAPTRKESLEALYEERLPDLVGSYIRDPQETGVLLSSGVDSAVVLAVATRQTGVALKSFTFDYGMGSTAVNEGVQARRVADLVGSEHSTIEVDARDIPAHLDSLLDVFGDPFAYGLHSVMLAAIHDAGVHDLLSGAATELIGGQEYNAMRYLNLPSIARRGVVSVNWLGESLLRLLSPRSAGRPLPMERILRAVSGGVRSARTFMDGHSDEQLLHPDLRILIYPDQQTLSDHRAARAALQASQLEVVQRLSTWERLAAMHSRSHLADHLHGWNYHAGRAHDLTIRSPFGSRDLWLDSVFLGFEARDKPSLRRYASGFLPDDVAYAPKGYQAVPINEWLRGPLKPWMHDVLDRRSVDSAGLFESKGVDRLVGSHLSGRADLGWPLWNLIVTHVWYDKVTATG